MGGGEKGWKEVEGFGRGKEEREEYGRDKERTGVERRGREGC